MAQAQADDHETQCLQARVTNLKLVDVLCDSSQGNIRPVVLESFCR
jgi:hypothetical protein